MVIEFTARHFKASDQLQEYARQELNRFKRFYNRVTQCQIIMIHENNLYTVELNVSVPNEKLNVKETTDNITKSIDQAVTTMIGRLKKHKEKLNAR